MSCRSTADTFHIEVSNDGAGLPEGFDVGLTAGFGLRAVRAIVSGYGGKVIAESLNGGGALFAVAIPMSVLLKKQGLLLKTGR